MPPTLPPNALDVFKACDLARALTGATPESGTQCWVYNMDDAGRPHKRCEKCPYFTALQAPGSLSAAEQGDLGIVTLPRAIDEKMFPDLKKLVDALLAKKKKALVFDCAALEQIAPGSLGLLLRAFKSQKERNAEFALLNPTERFRIQLRDSLLIKVLPVAASSDDIEARLRQQEEAVKSGEAARKEEEKRRHLEEAQSLRCWDFFKGHNPKNATACAVCHYKASGGQKPCWIVVGQVEGIDFEYIEEDCMDCGYYLRLNPHSDVQELG